MNKNIEREFLYFEFLKDYVDVGDQKFISRSSDGFALNAWGDLEEFVTSLTIILGSLAFAIGPRFSTDSAKLIPEKQIINSTLVLRKTKVCGQGIWTEWKTALEQEIKKNDNFKDRYIWIFFKLNR